MSATMEISTTKRCNKCAELKQLSEFYYARKHGRYHPSCKPCSRLANYKRRKNTTNSFTNAELVPIDEIKRRNNELKSLRLSHVKQRWEKLKQYKKKWAADRKAVREFFKMHRAMHAIAKTLNQIKGDRNH